MNARRIPWASLAALLAATALLQPPAAHAGVRVVRPEMFRPLDSAVPVFITPSFIASGSESPAKLTAPVRLPVGVKIRKMVSYHHAIFPGRAVIILARAKVGAAVVNSTDILLTAVVQDGVPLPGLPPLKVEALPSNPNADLTVRKGYRYFLIVESSHVTQRVTGVKVHYR